MSTKKVVPNDYVALTNTEHVRNGYFKGYIIIDLMLLFDIA